MPLNVLNVIVDQHQAQVTGYEGHPQAITPNLDRLADDGVRCRWAYTQNPICTPSRTSIFSGQYCHNHGLYGLNGPAPTDLPSFMSHFRTAGYRTAVIGQVHTPNSPRNWLADHVDLFADSFQSVDGVKGDTAFFDQTRAAGLEDKEDFSIHHRGGPPPARWYGRPSYVTFDQSQEGWCVQQAEAFIDGCDDQPFCMQVSLERPHMPCWPAQEFWDLFDDDLPMPPTFNTDISHRPPHFRATLDQHKTFRFPPDDRPYEAAARDIWHGYLASITHSDHALGRMLDHLDRRGLADNTIVVFTADHGAYATAFGLLEKAPGICSDFVCRVPMLWRVPGVTHAGNICEQFVENVDIAPTLAALCDLPPMPTADGKDVSRLLAGDDRPVRDYAVTEHPQSKALRWEHWRFVHYQPGMFDQPDVGELYDLAADPNESTNLYHNPAHQEIVALCRRKLTEWLIGTTRVRTILGADPAQVPHADDNRLPPTDWNAHANYL